jgi:hypothetical protein
MLAFIKTWFGKPLEFLGHYAVLHDWVWPMIAPAITVIVG